MGKSKVAVSKYAETVDELVSFVFRGDSDGGGYSLTEWVEWDMISVHILPNIPADVEDERQYVKEVFALFKQEALKRVQAWEPDWDALFDD